MKTTVGRPGAQVLGVGAHRPARVVTNDEIALTCDTSDAWIRKRTGIVTRRFAGPDETVASMATEAAGKALADAGVEVTETDLVLVATCTHARQVPHTAAEVATAIGGHDIAAVDISGGCAGFGYALGLAAGTIKAGTARHVIVVGAEKFSDFLDLTDRSTAFILGDGAGAVVLGASEEPQVGPVAWTSDGRASELIITAPEAPQAVLAGERPVLRMQGTAVFRWAVTEVAPVAQRACELAGVPLTDIDVFVPHQANLRIIDSLAKTLGLADRVIARDIIEAGNTSAASIPLALAALRDRGEARPGQLALLVGYGSGLAIAAQVIRLP